MPTTTTRRPLPESFYQCQGFAERSAWLAEENRKRCEAAAARKAIEATETAEDDGEWTLNPPAR